MDPEDDFDAEIAFLQQCKEDVAILKRLDAGEVIDEHAPQEIPPDDGLERFDEEDYGDGKEDENEKVDDRWEEAGEEGGYEHFEEGHRDGHEWAEGAGEDKGDEEEDEDINLDDFREEVAA